MIPENLKNKIVNTTIDISQYINDEYFSINNNVAYLVKIGKLRMIKLDVTLKKEINTDIYIFNFPANFLDIINKYFFGTLINRSGKSYDVAFYNQLESNNFSILIQPQYSNPISVDSRLIGEWFGLCKSEDTDINAEDNKYLNKEEVQALISKALDGAVLDETFKESQAEQDKRIQKLQNNMINESTEEATSLHVEDASDLPAVLNIRGNHYQEVQEGTSNLAILQEGTIEQNGMTINIQNGVATMSGSNTSDTTNYVIIGTAYLYAGQTYYMKAERSQTSGSSGLSIKLGSLIKWFTVGQEIVFECTQTGEYEVRVSFGVSAATNLGTFKLLISKTSGATWVQGKKTIPSVEYPSEISTVKDNIKIIIDNDNSEQKEYNLVVQQEMLQNDKFDLLNNKEVHIWKKIILNGTENWQQSSTVSSVFYLNMQDTTQDKTKFKLISNQYSFGKIIVNSNEAKHNKIYGFISEGILRQRILLRNDNFTTLDSFKASLAEKNMTLYYVSDTTTELDLTEEQKQVLNELNNIELFKGVNNIYTEQDLALLQLNYTADTKMYIDNKINSILGGN